MKSTIDFEDLIWLHLKGGNLSKEITGKLWKQERPVNSYQEDVVINSLPVNNFQLQTSVINVNIHVPNLSIKNNDVQEKIPNTVRLNQLFELAKIELTDVMIGDTYFDIQQQILFTEEESSYINIRLEIFNINISNK